MSDDVTDTFRAYAASETEDRPLTASLFLRTVFVAIGATALAILAIAIIVIQAREPDPWAPLGPFPLQTVEKEVIDVSEGFVTVVGEKCRFGTDGVQTTGTVSWRLVVPPGYVSPLPAFPAVVHLNGCTTTAFSNPIPDDVVDYVCTHQDASPWHIVGLETPVGDLVGDLVFPRQGLQLGWETEKFTLTCDVQVTS